MLTVEKDAEVKWAAIVLRMQQIQWPAPEVMNEAYADITAEWKRGTDREVLVMAALALGRTSSYSGQQMWTVEAAMAHNARLKAAEVEIPAAALPAWAPVAAPAVVELAPVVDPVDGSDKAKAANKAWRESIELRREALAQAKAVRDDKIKELREQYEDIEQQWDKYVADAREAHNKAKDQRTLG